MSIKHVEAVLNLGPEVSGARRMVLVVLADAADRDTGMCFPKVETIGAGAGITRNRTVTEALSWLEENGYIERKVNGWAGFTGQIPKDRRPNLYRLTLDRPRGADTDTPALSDTDTPRGADTDTQNRHIEPSLEPTTPKPPSQAKGADADGALFEDSVGRPKGRRQRQRVASKLDPMAEQSFEQIWARWRVGKKQAARDAFARYMENGGSMTELDARLSNYLTTRQAFNEIWGQPSTAKLHLSTFINRDHEDFEHGPVCPDRWRPPGGASWDKWIGDQIFYRDNGHHAEVSPWLPLVLGTETEAGE